MAEEKVPPKDITAAMKRMKSAGENKMCFDCHASNPTWASITYGVFLCIDCSAVHRGLGVHITFIRSINLDTNWTWKQLRCMQLGGNAKANAFFRQHNLSTSDSKAKYHSRVARMYKEKLATTVMKDIQLNGIQELHTADSQQVATTPEQKDADFFKEIEETHTNTDSPTTMRANADLDSAISNGGIDVGHLSSSPPKKDVRVPTIGGRKPTNTKKKGIATKKSGLGATRTKANFKEIESEALNQDKMREQMEKESVSAPLPEAVAPEDQALSAALMYKTASMKKEEDKMRNTDPKKAEQMERLGMGYGNRSTFSHSVSDSMKSVEQVKPVSKGSAREPYQGRSRDSPSNSFFDSYDLDESPRVTEEPPRYETSAFSNKGTWGGADDFGGSRTMQVEREDSSRSRSSSKPTYTESNSDDAQKKFAGAKSISSAQMFGTEQSANDHSLDQFSGQSGISSADLFGEKKTHGHGASVDYAKLKDSMHQVTGKLSNMASGVIGSLQSRYAGTN